VAQSREYWTPVDAAELRRGVAIDATAPGAVVRVSPIGAAPPLAPRSLELRRDGGPIDAARAFAHRADAAQLEAAGVDLGRGAAVAQIAPELGAGRFELRVANAEGRYLVHVFEPRSTTVLTATAARATAFAGGRIGLATRLDVGGKPLAGTQVGGQLVSPSGRIVEVAFARDAAGNARAAAQLPADAAVEPGLWELQVFAEGRDGKQRVQRDGRVAFAVVQPTARLAGSFRFDRPRVAFALPLEVAAPGRYEVSGTLFATGADGLSKPVAQAAAAAWFEPGARRLTLAFDRSHVPLGYGAPYELRALQLKDQARMGVLETRELAARVAAVDSRYDR
jgi:hypothetical protein